MGGHAAGTAGATEAWHRLARKAGPLTDGAELGEMRPARIPDDAWSRYLHAIVGPLCELVRRLDANIVGLAGPPGSGKSTLARLVAAALRPPSSEPLVLSLDDFYLPRADRLSRGIRWRGGPGSHDLRLLVEVLDRIRTGRTPIAVPRFSAHADDRAGSDTFSALPCPTLLEGWFLGYPGEGYGEILSYLDLLVFIEVETSTAKERRFGREAALREAGGGLSTADMQMFWDEVLAPGLTRWVPGAKRSADLVLEIDGEQRVRSVVANSETVASVLCRPA